jgi:hypothetical protein
MADDETIKAILARGVITADDVLKLRYRVFWKGVVTPDDAEMVFALNDRLEMNADPSWKPFFVEALTDYLVFQAEPRGYISDENADWLIARIGRSGQVDTPCQLELLVKVLERAQLSPMKLVTFALEQVKWGVIRSQGYVGACHQNEPGVVDKAETELVRRILFAFGGDGNISITRQEAGILFDINDATDEKRTIRLGPTCLSRRLPTSCSRHPAIRSRRARRRCAAKPGSTSRHPALAPSWARCWPAA